LMSLQSTQRREATKASTSLDFRLRISRVIVPFVF
jgi:hypothetical protein